MSGWTAGRLFALGIGAAKHSESPVVAVAIEVESAGTNVLGNGFTGGVERNARDDEFGKAQRKKQNLVLNLGERSGRSEGGGGFTGILPSKMKMKMKMKMKINDSVPFARLQVPKAERY